MAVLLPVMAAPKAPDAIAKEILAPLVNPVKVDTLKGPRPINARTYRLLYWLETARQRGGDVSGIMDTAQRVAELRKGYSPTITKGPEAGRGVHLDHILPVHITPELAARFYDLDAISDRENEAKGSKITKRELDLARRWNREGLLSAAGLAAVETARK